MNISNILTTALKTLNEIAPGFDPLKDHRAGDTVKGSSRFNDTIKDINDVIVLAEHADFYAMQPGFGGAVCLIFQAAGVVGVATTVETIEDEDYELRLHHGCLQPFGDVQEVRRDAKLFSIVLTPEKTANGIEYALASAYPGRPDEPPKDEDREGLSEGQRLSAAEVKRRGLRPKQA